MKSLWENIEAFTVVLNWDDDSTIDRIRKSFEEAGKLYTDILVIFPNKQQMETSKISNAQLICPKDLNLLKSVKSPEAKKFIEKPHEAILFLGTPDEKFHKSLKKMKSKTKIGINTDLNGIPLNFSTAKENPSEIVYFVKQNLEKIYE